MSNAVSFKEQVRELRLAYDIPTPVRPRAPIERAELIAKLIIEEANELRDAIEARDLVGILDALADLDVVVMQAWFDCGMLPLQDAAALEVHRSNMSKLDENGRPIINDGVIDPTRPVGKILKGPNYRPPDLGPLLSAYFGTPLCRASQDAEAATEAPHDAG